MSREHQDDDRQLAVELAETMLAAVAPDEVSILPEVSGEYFADCNVARPSRHARDADLARKLWETSEEIVAGL